MHVGSEIVWDPAEPCVDVNYNIHLFFYNIWLLHR